MINALLSLMIHLRLQFSRSPVEVSGGICFDQAGRILAEEVFSHGSADFVLTNIESIIDLAKKHGASAVLSFHNHPPPRGAEPSASDLMATRILAEALSSHSILLLDRWIISEDSIHSALKNNELPGAPRKKEAVEDPERFYELVVGTERVFFLRRGNGKREAYTEGDGTRINREVIPVSAADARASGLLCQECDEIIDQSGTCPECGRRRKAYRPRCIFCGSHIPTDQPMPNGEGDYLGWLSMAVTHKENCLLVTSSGKSVDKMKFQMFRSLQAARPRV